MVPTKVGKRRTDERWRTRTRYLAFLGLGVGVVIGNLSGGFFDATDTDDPEQRRRQRIVILAGPHKTASTTLQSFLYEVAGQAVWLRPENRPKQKGHRKRPHPAFRGWSWPVGVPEETKAYGVKQMSSAKFHAPLAALVTGIARVDDLPGFKKVQAGDPERRREFLAAAAGYFRDIFAVPWSEGSNLVIGTEALDGLVMALGGETTMWPMPNDEWAPVTDAGEGEARHVDPHSAAMIGRLLDVLPWNVTAAASPSWAKRPQRLRLSDIEVHVNYRTPRIDHAVSVWHQLHNGTTLQEFFARHSQELYIANSLALALQFVRRGLRTTLVDMAGAAAAAAAAAGDDATDLVEVQRGVLACDVLRIGNASGSGGDAETRGSCDGRGRLRLAGYKPAKTRLNSRKDPQPRDLTKEELGRADALLRRYDCGVWRRLRAYRTSGMLRVLYERGDDADCGKGGAGDGDELSFADVVREMKSLARRGGA